MSRWISLRPVEHESLRPLEVHHCSKYITILGFLPRDQSGIQHTQATSDHRWRTLDKTLRQICSRITMPLDQGKRIFEYSIQNNSRIIG